MCGIHDGKVSIVVFTGGCVCFHPLCGRGVRQFKMKYGNKDVKSPFFTFGWRSLWEDSMGLDPSPARERGRGS